MEILLIIPNQKYNKEIKIIRIIINNQIIIIIRIIKIIIIIIIIIIPNIIKNQIIINTRTTVMTKIIKVILSKEMLVGFKRKIKESKKILLRRDKLI